MQTFTISGWASVASGLGFSEVTATLYSDSVTRTDNIKILADLTEVYDPGSGLVAFLVSKPLDDDLSDQVFMNTIDLDTAQPYAANWE